MNRSQLVKQTFETLRQSDSEWILAEVRAVVDEFLGAVEDCVEQGEQVNIAGFCKFKTVDVDAKPARKGISPFTKEPTTFKAKPATTRLKIMPLKQLKDLAALGGKRRRRAA